MCRVQRYHALGSSSVTMVDAMLDVMVDAVVDAMVDPMVDEMVEKPAPVGERCLLHRWPGPPPCTMWALKKRCRDIEQCRTPFGVPI